VPLILFGLVAHAAGVFHNDDKLDNIVYLSATSKDVGPIDFGRATFGDMNKPLEVICNTVYQSPELLLGMCTFRKP
jgi:aminoglycoside phosphotransferase (APT) family kinase protein